MDAAGLPHTRIPLEDSRIIGQACRIGGEVGNSIFENFANKHHEGFVGHSHIGSWVNMGAMSTTSDLKNNYGIVKVKYQSKQISTDTIKFGSIIGDFSKIAIGVMLNTGTIVDIGSNVTKGRVNGYIPPFSWAESSEKYRLDHFIQDTKKIMARRNQTLSFEEEVLLKSLYEGIRMATKQSVTESWTLSDDKFYQSIENISQGFA